MEQDTTKNTTKKPKRNPTEYTTISVLKTLLDDLRECKHGKDTYDNVIRRLIAFYRSTTGKTIVE